VTRNQGVSAGAHTNLWHEFVRTFWEPSCACYDKPSVLHLDARKLWEHTAERGENKPRITAGLEQVTGAGLACLHSAAATEWQLTRRLMTFTLTPMAGMDEPKPQQHAQQLPRPVVVARHHCTTRRLCCVTVPPVTRQEFCCLVETQGGVVWAVAE